MNEANPPISRGLGLGMAVAVFVVLGGGLLLFFPDRPTRWIWPIGPFNALFLVVMAYQLPARAVVPVAWTFTAVVTVASVVSVAEFDFDQRGPWLWFAAYVGFTAFLPFYFRRLREGPQPPPTSPGWRRWFLVEGAFLCAYGAGLLVAPDPLTGFWPWNIDAFHGRIYSAVFLTFGVGSIVLAARSAPSERQALGLSRLVLGALAVAGLVLADSSAGTVDWTEPGTVLWSAAFTAIAVVGVLMLRPPRPRLPPCLSLISTHRAQRDTYQASVRCHRFVPTAVT